MDRTSLPDTPGGQDPLELALARELRTGERVLWRERQLARIVTKGFGLYLFAIPWTAFAVFWTAMAAVGVSTMQSDVGGGLLAWAFPLFGVPFIIIGMGMLSIPFVPLLQRGKVLYAITDRRLLKLTLGRTLKVDSIPARRVGAITRIERPDGSGSLKIAVSVGTDSDGDKQTEHFEIGDVKDVLRAHDLAAQIGHDAGASGRFSPSASNPT